MDWKPIETAPVGDDILVSNGGEAGKGIVGVAKLRPVDGVNELQVIGYFPVEAKYWAPYNLPA